jgi:catechol-2,3-dioxygenase
LFLTDPAGNHYAVFTAKDSNDEPTNTTGRVTGVGYIELEAPDVSASVDFYAKVLGFELQTRNEGKRQAMLKIASGQSLILTEAPFASKGLVMSHKVPGPHIAFYVPAAKWGAALTHLDKLQIANGDRGAAKERHDGQGGTYMDDPAGYVIQFITDGME